MALQRRMWFSSLHHLGGAGEQMSSGTIYYSFIGTLRSDTSIRTVWAKTHLGSAGSGLTQTEFALFSTATPPQGGIGPRVMTKLAVQSSSSMTLAEVMVSSAFTTVVPAGTHLWAAFRCLGTTGPKLSGLDADGLGVNLVTAAAPLISSQATFLGSPSVANNAGSPGLYVSTY